MPYPYQTTVGNIDAIRFGSMKVEAGSGTSSMTDLGVAKGVTFEEQITYAWIGMDNAQRQRRVVKQEVVISGSLVEFSPEDLNIIRGGIDVYTSSTGDGSKKILETGGKHVQTPKVWELTNLTVSSDPTTKLLRITVYKGFFDGNMTLAFQPDEDENPMEMPFTIIGIMSTGTTDSTYVPGTGLYKIEDFQSTS